LDHRARTVEGYEGLAKQDRDRGTGVFPGVALAKALDGGKTCSNGRPKWISVFIQRNDRERLLY